MSNCIDIVHGFRIKLKPKEVDGYKLRELLTKAEKEVNQDNCSSEKIAPELRIAWWFLSRNTRIKGNHAVEIKLGAGRSTHTNRDFKATLWLLSKFIKKPVFATFGITDEYDGHRQIFKERYNLQSGEK